MKIVIADDEQLIRISLNSMIKEFAEDWIVVGEASHGEEMLALLAQHQPDVAIVDIRMPQLDGIEVIRRGITIAPKTKWIIISGFSDFKYAQQAIKLGVNEYLLKPVAPDDLEHALRTIYLQNVERNNLLNCQFENRLLSLFQGVDAIPSETQDDLLQIGSFQSLTLYFNSQLNSKQLEQFYCQLNASIRASMSDYLVHGAHLALFTLNEASCVITGAWDHSIPRAAQSIRQFFLQIEELIGPSRQTHTAITAIYSDTYNQVEKLIAHSQQLQEWSGLHLINGINKIVQMKELEQLASNKHYLELSQLLLRLANDYRNGLYLEYQNTVKNLSVWFAQRENLVVNTQIQHNIVQYVKLIFNIALNDHDWRVWTEQLNSLGEHLLHHTSDTTSQPLIDKVLQFIEENFMNDISLNQIAHQMNVTPSYLSVLFHKKTGTNFIKYLMRLRILKSKELLCTTNLHIQQVAEQVGYYSTRYFTKLFVETVGEYPSDFRKNKRLAIDTNRTSKDGENKLKDKGEYHVEQQI